MNDIPTLDGEELWASKAIDEKWLGKTEQVR